MSIPPELLTQILNGPAQKSPDGVYQFDNPPNHNTRGLVAAGVCLSIATAVVLLRAYSRLFCTKRIRIEDGLGLIGYITFLGAFVDLVLTAQTPGLWVHLWDIRVRDLEPYIKKVFAFVTCYGLTMFFVKAAVLVEWTRIFVPAGRNFFFWTCYTILFMNGVLYVAAITATWLTCIPQRKIWRSWEPGHCFERKRMDETVIVFNLFFDLVILLLPQKVIWELHTTQKHKLGVALVFSVGLLACACAAGRVHATFSLSYDNDSSYNAIVVQLWGLAEGTCVLMVFCLTSAPKVFKSNQHLITRIAHSVRSGTRIPWSREGSPQGSQKSGERVYRPMDAPPLADLEAARVKPNGELNSIIKTKEFSTQEAPNTGNAEVFHDQHPWIQERPKSTPPR